MSVEVVDVKGQSALVLFYRGDIPCRSYVDISDITEELEVPDERLADAPYGVDWMSALDVSAKGLKHDITLYLRERGIWTLEDLRQNDRVVIRLATDLLGKAIWKAAKKACTQ